MNFHSLILQTLQIKRENICKIQITVKVLSQWPAISTLLFSDMIKENLMISLYSIVSVFFDLFLSNNYKTIPYSVTTDCTTITTSCNFHSKHCKKSL